MSYKNNKFSYLDHDVSEYENTSKQDILCSILGNMIDFLEKEFIETEPRSNMHDRKRPFTEKNGDIQRSCTASVYDACTRSDTVGNGFRIRRSYKNAK